MCDTLAALQNTTQDGSVIFGKNSDRHPNEAQAVELIPGSDHPPNSPVKCTYIEVPQVEKTNTILICRPVWMWGAEMGVNEHGVVIGNEAIFSKISPNKEPRLIGMDLIRLALERTSTAQSALETITDLLEKIGQGGNHAIGHKLYYHNSFLIADRNEAWVLDTVDHLWIAKRVGSFTSISNKLSIQEEWDLVSDNFKKTNTNIENSNFNLSKSFSDKLITWAACSNERSERGNHLLRSNNGKITPLSMMNILRDHGTDGNGDDRHLRGLRNSSICAHAGWGPARRDTQSTGSMVVHLTQKDITIWVTGTSSPCTSLYKPVWFEGGLPDVGLTPSTKFNDDYLWWRHEKLHRKTLENFPTYLQTYKDELHQHQIEFYKSASAISQNGKSSLTEQCFPIADECESEWYRRLCELTPSNGRPWYMKRAWKKFNREAKIQL